MTRRVRKRILSGAEGGRGEKKFLCEAWNGEIGVWYIYTRIDTLEKTKKNKKSLATKKKGGEGWEERKPRRLSKNYDTKFFYFKFVFSLFLSSVEISDTFDAHIHTK